MFPACTADYPEPDSNVAVTVVADQLIIQKLTDDGKPSVRPRWQEKMASY